MMVYYFQTHSPLYIKKTIKEKYTLKKQPYISFKEIIMTFTAETTFPAVSILRPNNTLGLKGCHNERNQ